MLKNIKSKLEETTGNISIIAIILAFILTISFTAYSNIAKDKWVLNELQSKMDIIGTNALQTSVDLKQLRAEILALDGNNKIDINTKETILSNYEYKIKQTYNNEIRKQISTNEQMTSFNILSEKVYFDNSIFGLGTSNKVRPQITMDVTAKVCIKNSGAFGDIKQVSKLYEAKTGRSYEITYKGASEDGNAEFVVRSVSRLVYR